MKISKRERIILIITIVIVAGALFYQFGLSGFFTSFASTMTQLTGKSQTYESFKKQLDRMPPIQKKYRQIEKQFAKNTANKSADQVFTEDIERLCNSLQITPNIEPPQQASIEDIDNYSEISLTVSVSGDLQKIVRLLKGFNDASLIITALRINSSLDRDTLDVEVTVARISKIEPVVLEKKEKGQTQQDQEEKDTKKTNFKRNRKSQ